ncbi:MAG: DUF5103 domain-containing protein [Bacteroidaceae bacterium]
MRIYLLILSLCIITWQPLRAQRNEVIAPNVKTLQVTVNDDWLLPPVINLNSPDFIDISFDELTHEYHRYIYIITHCNADWTPSELMEIDYLNGFNNNPIDDYRSSFNTTMLYTHYKLRLPNENAQPIVSGNYVVTVYDDNNQSAPILKACFSVIEPNVSVSASVSSNTDIDTNASHQQVSFNVNYQGYAINTPQNEVKVQVFQNLRTDNMVTNITPTYVSPGQLQYVHNRNLIFDAGNEYRRFEITNMNYATQGVDKITYFNPYYHAILYPDEARKNYSFDVDQNGRYFIRYNLAQDNETEADYLFVHFTLDWDMPLIQGDFFLQGEFTYDRFDDKSKLTYNAQDHAYECVQLLKQGAYNYLYLYVPQGKSKGETAPAAGNFYETENEYLILVYHRPFGGRYDKLIGMQQVKFQQQ